MPLPTQLFGGVEYIHVGSRQEIVSREKLAYFIVASGLYF
jgi:hypothetical protein